jgi:hypothetical protein
VILPYRLDTFVESPALLPMAETSVPNNRKWLVELVVIVVTFTTTLSTDRSSERKHVNMEIIQEGKQRVFMLARGGMTHVVMT